MGSFVSFLHLGRVPLFRSEIGFIFENEAILSRMVDNLVTVTVLGVFVHITSFSLLGLGSSILLLLTNMFKILST